jgi:hypothetical protein
MQPDPFRDQPVVKGDRLRLQPLGPEHFDGIWEMLNDAEGARMTGSTRTFEEEFARSWVATRQDHGYGTEATGLVLDYAFDTVGLHRVELEVYDFNGRGQRCYEKAGFVQEGVLRESRFLDGRWVDTVVMAILRTDPRPRVAR